MKRPSFLSGKLALAEVVWVDDWDGYEIELGMMLIHKNIGDIYFVEDVTEGADGEPVIYLSCARYGRENIAPYTGESIVTAFRPNHDE